MLSTYFWLHNHVAWGSNQTVSRDCYSTVLSSEACQLNWAKWRRYESRAETNVCLKHRLTSSKEAGRERWREPGCYCCCCQKSSGLQQRLTDWQEKGRPASPTSHWHRHVRVTTDRVNNGAGCGGTPSKRCSSWEEKERERERAVLPVFLRISLACCGRCS